MRGKIEGLPYNDLTFCMEVLSSMAIAHQPLHISELAALINLPQRIDLTAV